jgi:hypothetical protein
LRRVPIVQSAVLKFGVKVTSIKFILT